MGTRFLAVLSVVALGAASAMVGMTMASGEWSVVGTGLEPGQGYAVQVGAGFDRLKLELSNPVPDAVATFSLYGPDGARAGFFRLDAGTRVSEVVTEAKGAWMVFVYKAQGSDLTLSVHGSEPGAAMKPAEVERRETVLGQVRSTSAVDQTFTAVVGKEPVLANVYLKGSARNFQSELFTEKGVVEVVAESEVAAAQTGAIVDSRGERSTLPQNLAAGPFTAKVKADSLSGSLMLVTLYLVAPDFTELTLDDEEEAEEDDAPKARDRKHRPHTHAPPPPKAAPRSKAAPPAAEWTACGTIESRVPYGLDVPGGVLKLTLGEEVDPFVTVFSPDDRVVAVVQLEEQGQEETVALGMPGEYVLYARGMRVDVSMMGVEECELRELGVEAVGLAAVRGELLRPTEATADFALATPPLEFGVRLASPEAVALGLEAVFTGPDGEAARAHMGFGSGLTGDAGFPLPFWGGDERRGRAAHAQDVEAEKMLDGDWVLDLRADSLTGDVEALALLYVREPADDRTDH